MSGFYPSLEDLVVNKMALHQVEQQYRTMPAIEQRKPDSVAKPTSLYGSLGLEEMMQSYASPASFSASSTQQLVPQKSVPSSSSTYRYEAPLAHITPIGDKALACAEVKQGVREVILCKDQRGKVGLCTQSIDKGVFISLVFQSSPAALAGLRFGDQILQINGENVAGWSVDKTMTTLKKADASRISLIIRDRPYDRAVTVVKDSGNIIGFTFSKGVIDGIVKDSSAARNGLLINHQLVEVNAHNVVGLPDKDILQLIRDAPRSVTLTIMPVFVFNYLTKQISTKDLRTMMERGLPDC